MAFKEKPHETPLSVTLNHRGPQTAISLTPEGRETAPGLNGRHQSSPVVQLQYSFPPLGGSNASVSLFHKLQ